MEAPTLVLFFLFLNQRCQQATSPPSPGVWTITNKHDQQCMVMSFSAQVEAIYGQTQRTFNILPTFEASSLCSEPYRQFSLVPPNSSRTKLPQLHLSFKLNKNIEYTMIQAVALWIDPTNQELEGDFKQGTNLLPNTVYYKYIYQCDQELVLDLDGGYGKVYLWDMKLRPFAEDSGGQVQVCSSSSTVVIVSSVVGVLAAAIIIVIIATVCFKYCKRSRSTNLTVNAWNTESVGILSGR
ncbi:uncharacterized protein LOC110988410 isoform X2 [Acanthaster planci]|uniref:Uncharacterized protein LOC110988410 isoform X2 n=1 Tax=Acanthaster planci TaxID=133434 RepID=A0A8B7ZRQ0_ACAPL|nr:uncharacterized protein LOC110988410 isoform X2 [Acanthaster planci]